MTHSSFPENRLKALFLLLALGSSGCGGLRFSEEKCVIVIEPQRDEAQVLLVYEDFHVAGDAKDYLESAQKQLDSMFTQPREFLVFSPLFGIDLSEVDNDPGDDEDRRTRELFRKHFTISNAALVLNREGKLCGQQTIRIREVKRFVEQFNVQFSKWILEASTRALGDKTSRREEWEAESWRLVQRAAQGQFQWLRVAAGRISFTWPATPAYVRDMKRSFLEHELSAGVRGNEQLIRLVGDTAWSFDQRPDQFSLSLGVGAGTPIELTLAGDKIEKRYFEKELLAHATKICPEMKKNVEIASIVAKFLEDHAAGKGSRP